MSKKQKKSWVLSKINDLKLNIRLTGIVLIFVMLPIAVLGGIVFYNMEQSSVKENVNFMQATMERRQDSIANNIDSINMTTQFFLSNDTMNNVLICAAGGGQFSTRQWIDIYRNDVAALERLINNNPVLKGVRYYAVNDNIQEMMPVLFNHSRMNKQSWSHMASTGGWIFDYRDNLFANSEGEPLIALITPMSDKLHGRIGVIEANMAMRTMFPSMYEDISGESSCFVTDEGRIIYGSNEDDGIAEIAIELASAMKEPDQSGELSRITTSYKKEQKSVISGMYIPELKGTLVSVNDISDSLSEVYKLRTNYIIGMLIILAGMAFVIDVVVNHVLKKFYEVLATIRKVRGGDMEVRTREDGRTDEMGELAHQVNRMLDNIHDLMKENINREVLVKDSQIKALQNQINAHFIYNVLESIKMMAEIKEDYDISDAITSLGKLLRYSMKWTSETVLVSEEIEYIKNYMALINLRFDYEIYLSLNMPEEILSQRIPKMSLQPIIENAIVHGIEELADDTTIYMKGIPEGNLCTIEITDNGRGMNDEELEILRKKISGELPTAGGSGNGIGLKNVQDRIRMEYGDEYGIEVAAMEGCYTKVYVKIPMKRGLNADSTCS
ncbi:sensor histidine kinase [Butyrivibrio sp. XBB1001]|uniref:sensor histidine kinase n=1 Tax=Butyrivibrio sp. XBB1001 TaxID=1280682 RepID=UPI000478E976|nr:sensor histidine kinase [Butyrivibrio sp. XBB1001]